MKKIIFIFLFCLSSSLAQSQRASVEKSVSGVQTGFLGIWVHNEFKLSNRIALRIELGFDGGFFGGIGFDSRNGNFLLAPVFTVEPRWYYNLNKRNKKSKRIDGNSANFITLQTSFNPDWFLISNVKNVSIDSQVSFIPTWGIRRNIANHFNFEAGAGLGYILYFERNFGRRNSYGGAAINIQVRIGYRF